MIILIACRISSIRPTMWREEACFYIPRRIAKADGGKVMRRIVEQSFFL
jgi:hypothetical protein